MPWAIPVAIGLSAVGAGLSYVATTSAASQQSQLALLNAQAQTQAATQQGQLGAMQASINQTLAEKDAAAAEANARVLEQQAALGTDAAQSNVKKTREDYARILAAQRVQAAKAGVADTTGSPLELLMQTAVREQNAADQIRYEDEVNRRGLFGGAVEARNQGVLARIQGLSQQSQAAGARGNAAAAIAQAKLEMYSQRASADGLRGQAFGGLLSSAGGLALQAGSYFRASPGNSFRASAPYAAGFNSAGIPRASVIV